MVDTKGSQLRRNVRIAVGSGDLRQDKVQEADDPNGLGKGGGKNEPLMNPSARLLKTAGGSLFGSLNYR